MERIVVVIEDELITLGQMLKLVEVIGSGGEAKWFLRYHDVFVGGEKEGRRGRKLYDGDLIRIDGKEYLISHGDK